MKNRRCEFGPMRQWAIENQIKVGTYLGVGDLVPVVQAHIMADTESLGARTRNPDARLAGVSGFRVRRAPRPGMTRRVFSASC